MTANCIDEITDDPKPCAQGCMLFKKLLIIVMSCYKDSACCLLAKLRF